MSDKDLTKGEKLYRDGRYDESFPILLDAADEGNPEAQFLVAESYKLGLGCRQSSKYALDYYDLAAHQGFELAEELAKDVYIDGYQFSVDNLSGASKDEYEHLKREGLLKPTRNESCVEISDNADKEESNEKEWSDVSMMLLDYADDNRISTSIEERIPILTILYAASHNIKLEFDENGEIKALPNCSDNNFMNLFNVSRFCHHNYKFGNVSELYHKLCNEYNTEMLKEDYHLIAEQVIELSEPYNNSTKNLSLDILASMMRYINDGECDSIYIPYCGICSASRFISRRIKVLAQDPSGFSSILSLNLLAETGKNKWEVVNSDPMEFWPKEKFDAVVSYASIKESARRENALTLLFKNIERSVKRRAVVLVDFDYCACLDKGMFRDIYDTRRHLCEIGALDVILELKDCIGDKRCAIVFLDFLQKHDRVTFIDASGTSGLSFLERSNIINYCTEDYRHVVSYEDMKEQDYTWVSAAYIQDAKVLPGQELVKIGDLVEFDEGVERVGTDYEIALREDFSPELLRALNVPRRHFEVEIPDYDPAPIYAGPHLFMLFDGRVKLFTVKNNDKFCIFMNDIFVMKVKEDVVDMEYLASILLKDRSFMEYLANFYQQCCLFNDYIRNRKIAIYTDLEKQKIELERSISEALTAAKARQDYNLIFAGFFKENIMEKFSNNGLKSFDYVNTFKGEHGLIMSIAENVTKEGNGQKVHAIVVDANIPLTETNSGSFKGLRRSINEIISLRKGGFDIPFYIVFDGNHKELLEELEEFEKDELHFIFDGKHVISLNDTQEAINCIRAELDEMYSSEGTFKKKYYDEFTAAQWLDAKWVRDKNGKMYSFSIVSTIAKQLTSFLNGELEEMSFDALRLCAHRIIDMMQQMNLVPSVLDYGAIPSLLQDSRYEDKKTYYQYNAIMPATLVSSMTYFVSASNAGVHGMVIGRNIPGALLQILLELLNWTYTTIIEGKLDGRGHGQFFWDEFHPRQMEMNKSFEVFYFMDGKNPYWYCGYDDCQVHLLPPQQGFSDGDRIRFKKTELFEEKKPRFENDRRIILFARKDDYELVK